MAVHRRRLVADVAGASLSPHVVAAPAISDFERGKRRLRRSSEILQAVQQIDVTTDPATRQQLADWMRQCYEDRQGGELLGLFAKCHLGAPFVDHRLSLAGGIMEHFRPEDPVPPGFAPGRALARSSAYLFIEIYSDGQVVPVRADGTPAV